MMEWPEELRIRLQTLISSSDWEPVKMVLDALTTQASRACETCTDDHRFYQGQVFAYKNLANQLVVASIKNEKIQADHTPVEHFSY